MKGLVTEIGYLARYGAVGLASNISLYVFFVAFVWAGVSPVVAAGTCYAAGICLNYILHRRYTFRSTSVHRADVPKYVLAMGTGFIATLILIAVLTKWMRPEIAQILNVLLTAGVIYAMLRLLRFGGITAGSESRDD